MSLPSSPSYKRDRCRVQSRAFDSQQVEANEASVVSGITRLGDNAKLSRLSHGYMARDALQR